MLAAGVVHATWTAVLIARPGRATSGPPCGLGAVGAAIAMAAVAVATDRHLTTAAGAVEQTGSIVHRQLLPMSPGSPPTSGRYLPTVRARHAPGYGTGEDCGGRDQCRTCLNGTDPVDHGAALVTALTGHPPARVAVGTCAPCPTATRRVGRLGAAPGPVPGCATLRRGRDPAQRRSHAAAGPDTRPFPLTTSPPNVPQRPDRSSPPSLATARAIRQLSAGFRSHRQYCRERY